MGCLASSVDTACDFLYLKVLSSSPTLGIEFTLKKKNNNCALPTVEAEIKVCFFFLFPLPQTSIPRLSLKELLGYFTSDRTFTHHRLGDQGFLSPDTCHTL